MHSRVARVLVQGITLHLYVKNWMMGGGGGVVQKTSIKNKDTAFMLARQISINEYNIILRKICFISFNLLKLEQE